MMNSKIYSLVISCILLAGCKTISPAAPSSLITGSQIPEQKIYLDTTENQAVRLAVFLKNRTSLTEMDKIRYLLAGIRKSPYQFERNGATYESSQAMRWLRWKMTHSQYRSDPIRTAKDFVTRVADRSLTTGQTYKLVIDGRTTVDLQPVLQNELDALEAAVREKIFQETAAQQTVASQAPASAVSLPVVPMVPLSAT